MVSVRWTEQDIAAYRSRQAKAPPQQVESKPQGPSKLEIRFVQQLETAQVQPWVREFYFLDGRDFRLDFAWPALRIGVEVQGMAHRIKGRFKADIEKRALALLAGWRVLEVDGAAIRSGNSIAWLKQLLG